MSNIVQICNSPITGENTMTEREKILWEEGWERQCIVTEPRLSELAELYESIGFEVILEPVDPNGCGTGCRECFKDEANLAKHRTIYTRKKSGLETE